MFSPRVRRQFGWVLAAALLVVIGFAAPAHADANLVQNPGLEALDANGFPVCWERSGFGDNTFTFGPTTEAHSGRLALQISITRLTSGDRKAMMLENAQCAPRVMVGRQYELSVWYKSTTAANAVTLF